MNANVRLYRALTRLYPRRFRTSYRDDMVFVFEEMLRDSPAAGVWLRVVADAAKSIPVQHSEAVMTSRSSNRSVATASVGLFAVGVTLILIGGFLAIPGLLAVVAGSCLAAYWQSRRAYNDASALHDGWYRFVLGGVLLLVLMIVGSGLDLTLPWLVLFATIQIGIILIAAGLMLGVWHAVRRTRDNGAWPAS